MDHKSLSEKSYEFFDVFFTGLICFLVGVVVAFVVMGIVSDGKNGEPPISDYRKIEVCEMVLRSTFRVPDFLDCLNNHGLRLVVK